MVLDGADLVVAAGSELAFFLWCFFTFAGAVVEEELVAGAGVVPVWAAISADPASNMAVNDEVIRVFITLNSPWGFPPSPLWTRASSHKFMKLCS